MSAAWSLRLATPSDATLIAEHRVRMFREMGELAGDGEPRLRAATEAYVRGALASGEYVGWLAHESDAPERIVAGAGVQRRPLLPRPTDDHAGVLLGAEGLILNVWVEPAWRRQGIADAMLNAIMAWAPGAGIVRLSLHASRAGRPLYERLGFAPTTEMRLRP